MVPRRVWGDRAERIAERLRKGNKVYVEGRIQTRQWEDRTARSVPPELNGTARSTSSAAARRGRQLRRPVGRAPAPARPAPSAPATAASPTRDPKGEFDDLPF